jgi:hypothetical protein
VPGRHRASLPCSEHTAQKWPLRHAPSRPRLLLIVRTYKGIRLAISAVPQRKRPPAVSRERPLNLDC